MTKGPYLQNVTTISIVVMWEVDDSDAWGLSYGLPGTALVPLPGEAISWVTTQAPRKLYTAVLTDLTPDTTYAYEVSRGSSAEGTGRFTTAPVTSRPFRFAAYGDSRGKSGDYTLNTTHQRIANAIAANGADLVIHTGDLIYSGSTYAVWGPHYFSPAAELIRNTVVFPAPGNHDGPLENYRKFFCLPAEPSANEHWYSFDYGDSHFISLDTRDTTDCAPGTEQYVWLAGDLQQASLSARFIFVYYHIPTYTSTDTGYTDDANLKKYLGPLFKQYRVDMVFAGHSHLYERYMIEGVPYIVTGGGGARLYGLGPDDKPPYRAAGYSAFHYCLIDVTGQSATLKAIDIDGTELDWVTVYPSRHDTFDDAYEPNDDAQHPWPADPASWRATWLSSINGAGQQWDEDWYQISIPRERPRLSIEMTFGPAQGDLSMDLRRSDAPLTVLASSTPTPSGAQLHTDVQMAGTYLIRVSGANTGSTYDLWWDTDGLAGDADGDGCVNVADLLTVRNCMGSTGTVAGDLNGDGICNVADLLMVRNNLGNGICN